MCGVLHSKIEDAVTLPQIAQRKHAFCKGIKKMSKTKKLPSRKKIAFKIVAPNIRSQINQIIVRWGYF